MTSKDIQKKLRQKFDTHKYILENSYIYNWESDFFSVTSSGYAQEIEIKVSLSDFKADFKKEEKHKILKGKQEGLKHILQKGYNTYNYQYEELKTLLIDGKRQFDERTKKYIQVPSGELVTSQIVTGDIDKFLRNKHNTIYKQVSSGIRIIDIPKCPNKFYYCCPKGVIPIDLVPDYAGLYYIDDNMRMVEVKKASFIHKEKQDLNKILLDKFYYLSLNLRSVKMSMI